MPIQRRQQLYPAVTWNTTTNQPVSQATAGWNFYRHKYIFLLATATLSGGNLEDYYKSARVPCYSRMTFLPQLCIFFVKMRYEMLENRKRWQKKTKSNHALKQLYYSNSQLFLKIVHGNDNFKKKVTFAFRHKKTVQNFFCFHPTTTNTEKNARNSDYNTTQKKKNFLFTAFQGSINTAQLHATQAHFSSRKMAAMKKQSPHYYWHKWRLGAGQKRKVLRNQATQRTKPLISAVCSKASIKTTDAA